MDTQPNYLTPGEHATDHATRVRQVLHGQHAPQATGGWGRRALFQCPYCGHIWLMDGPDFHMDLMHEELDQIAKELGATLGDLPQAPCSPCAQTHARYRVDRDEYVTADGRLVGYGFNVEGDDPLGAHFTMLVHHAAEFMRHLDHGMELRAHVPVHPNQERQIWIWLAHLDMPSKADQYYRDRELGDPNPLGHNAPGTLDWRWGGAIWVTACPPLGGSGLVHLSLAIPPQEQVSIYGLVTICRSIAQGALDDHAFFG